MAVGSERLLVHRAAHISLDLPPTFTTPEVTKVDPLYIPTAVFLSHKIFWGHVQKFLLVVFNLFVRNQRFVQVSSQHEKDIFCEIDSSFP